MAPRRSHVDDRSGNGLLASLGRYWARSYASDYLGFTLIILAWILIQILVEPFHRMFFINDMRISFPHAEVERVPLYMSFVYSLFVPLAAIVVALFIARARPETFRVAILGFAIALSLTSLITDIIKNAVGRPRPDLIARCVPAADTPRDTLVSIDVCTRTGNHHVLHDGWRSFPSGHSSFAFAGLGYLALLLAGQTKVFVLRGNGARRGAGVGGVDDSASPVEVAARGDLLRALLCLLPLLGAAMIAISRCEDYRHDVYDVCIGALLGFLVTYWSYRRYWPRLTSRRCNEPYPTAKQIDDTPDYDDDEGSTGSSRYGRLRDQEQGLNVGYELS